MSTTRSSQKSILVTGAAKRVGAAIARALHAAGANVIIHCNHSRADAAALATELNQLRAKSAEVVQGDLLATNALKGLIVQAHSCFGRFDGLVNNASSFYPTPIGTIDEDHWNELMGSNLKAPLWLSQAAAPYLREAGERGGAIVNIIDIHVNRPLKDFVVYNAAKAGLAGLTKSLALDLGPEIRVNGVSPGAIMWPEDEAAYPPEERARIIAQTPLKRIGSAEDIAGAVRYLMLDAPYVTGQILAVDGGREIAL